MKFFSKENLGNMAETASAVLNTVEAQKAEKIGADESVIVQKITAQNFWKNKRFYIIIGSLIVAGASGNVAGGVPLLSELIEMLF